MISQLHSFRARAAAGLLAVAFSGGGAAAAENITGDIGFSYNSHFITYGLDVWGGSDNFFGKQSTYWIFGDAYLKANDWLTFSLSVWTDNNNNVPSGIGGNLQEVDINPGFSATFGKFTYSFTYNAWHYAGDVERSVDLAVAYDDTGLFMEGFGFKPKVLWHYRADPNGGQRIGSAIVASVSPTFKLGDSPISLSIPAGISFFTTETFQGGTSGGYGFGYLGGTLNYTIEAIPMSYGAWTLSVGLTEYFTRNAAIPSNPTENFLTGSMGVTVAF